MNSKRITPKTLLIVVIAFVVVITLLLLLGFLVNRPAENSAAPEPAASTTAAAATSKPADPSATYRPVPSPDTHDFRQVGIAAAVRVFTWDTGKESRSSVIQRIVADAATPGFSKRTAYGTPEVYERDMVNALDQRLLPTEDAWRAFAQGRAYAHAEVKDVRADGELTEWNDFKETSARVMGAHTVTVTMRWALEDGGQPPRVFSPQMAGVKEASVTVHVQCDIKPGQKTTWYDDETPEFEACGVVAYEWKPIF